MANVARDAEIAEIDAFLAETKRLRGGPPPWHPSGWNTEFQAVWNVEDVNGVVRAQLRLICLRAINTYPKINLIIRGRSIWRVEIEDPPRPHRNPHWAAQLGLPAIVVGSHEHTWPDNRDHVAAIAPDWDLPCHRALQPNVRRLPQALASFAQAIHLEIDSGQRSFDVPPQRELL